MPLDVYVGPLGALGPAHGAKMAPLGPNADPKCGKSGFRGAFKSPRLNFILTGGIRGRPERHFGRILAALGPPNGAKMPPQGLNGLPDPAQKSLILNLLI